MTDEDELPGFQRKHLRGLAHPLKPVVRVGRSGLTDPLIREIQRALEDHELIKVSMHKPPDKKALARDLALRSGAQLAGLLGHTAVLYRARSEKPTIRLPERAEEPEDAATDAATEPATGEDASPLADA